MKLTIFPVRSVCFCVGGSVECDSVFYAAAVLRGNRPEQLLSDGG